VRTRPAPGTDAPDDDTTTGKDTADAITETGSA